MPPLHDKLILQAEDDENDVIFLKYVFKSAGIPNPLVAVADGQEVIDYLSGTGAFSDRLAHPIPTLIFLDLKMPKINGLEVLEKLKADPELRSIPVVMLTSSNESADVIKSYELGANSYIVKPVDIDNFYQAIKELGLYWLIQNQTAKAV